MGKAAFIIPYFGKFNNYFQLFLNSCRTNKDYDWLIFTDDKTSYDYPENVIVHYTSFEEIKQLFQSKFDFKISLEYPYKLCDYKPTYGYVFESYLKDYQFWGHCDTDLIWGDISHFISDMDFLTYDKIGILGHCTLYRNTAQINTVFMHTLNGKERYKDIYTVNYNNSFDEEFNQSINNIFEECGYKINYREHEANIYTKSSDFKITRLNLDTKTYLVENKTRSFFVWDNGQLIRYKIVNGNIVSDNYLYIHMQSRKMKVKNIKNNRYKIIPNAFEDIEVDVVSRENFNSIKFKNFNLHYFILRTHNLFDKIRKLLKIC